MVKKEGWVNIYKSDIGSKIIIAKCLYIFKTKYDADNVVTSEKRIDCQKIEWEE